MTEAQRLGHARRIATRRARTEEGLAWARRWREESRAEFAALAAAGAFAPEDAR